MNVIDGYIKVGRIKSTVAKKAHVKSAYIYIDESHLKHIEKKHGGYLAKLGIDAETFVRCICQNFNQMRHGTESSVLLVVYRNNLHYVAAIDLNYSLKKGFWEVKTAQPRYSRAVLRLALMWTGAKNLSAGNGSRSF